MKVSDSPVVYSPSLAVRLIVGTPRFLFTIGLGLIKIAILPLQATAIIFLTQIEKILAARTTNATLQEHVGALVQDLKELKTITQHYAKSVGQERLLRADEKKGGAKFIRILPTWRHKNSVPILYAPGYLDNPETCRDTCRRLADSTGCPVYIPKYRKLFQSIREHANDVSSVRDRMLRESDKTGFIYFGHSMGGLATGLSLVKDKGDCKLWGTIATPLRGTRLATVAFGACGREMKPNSRIIQELHNSPFLPEVPSLHIYSHRDQLVRPYSAQAIFAKPHAQNYLCKKPCGHLAVRVEPAVEMEMASAVKKVLAPC